jgi:hypothetical protein
MACEDLHPGLFIITNVKHGTSLRLVDDSDLVIAANNNWVDNFKVSCLPFPPKAPGHVKSTMLCM